LEDLRQIKEFRHLKWPDAVADFEDFSKKHLREPLIDKVATIARQESCSGNSEICFQSRISKEITCASGARAPPDEERPMRTTAGVTLGNTQPISMEGTDSESHKNWQRQIGDQIHNYDNAFPVHHNHELRIPVILQHSNRNENDSLQGQSTELFHDCAKTADVPQNSESHAEVLRKDKAAVKDDEIEISNSDVTDSRLSYLRMGAAAGAVALFMAVMHRS
jgi:hypothetical protein